MKETIKIGLLLIILGFLFLSPAFVYANKGGEEINLQVDSTVRQEIDLSFSHRFIHQVGVEVRPGYVFPTNYFLDGMNDNGKPIRYFSAAHLKYSFQFRPGTWADKTYGGAYQGIGLAGYTFGNARELGNPVALYLFQGARIARFTSRLSLNYEWNFGLSFGWKPYDRDHNRYNIMMGSKMNAYINTNFFLNWRLSPQYSLSSGVTLTHFSNGNTKFPNAGINMVGLKLGLVYQFNPNEKFLPEVYDRSNIPVFPRHVSYDLVLFGSWRRKGYLYGDEFIPSPDAYKVMGVNLAAMYNVSYKFRAGIALDGVYDASANVFTKTVPGEIQGFVKPPFNAQVALGVSGRIEYVMPYFTVGIGMGANVLHRGGDLKAYYQMLLLKISVTRNTFLHVGYNLQNFRDPNYLMLGIGFRFNNKYPVFYR